MRTARSGRRSHPEPRSDDLAHLECRDGADARGAGLGDTLLAAAETRARELGKRMIRLYTGERLVENVAWYQRRGYAIERTETASDRRIVHMMKKIEGE